MGGAVETYWKSSTSGLQSVISQHQNGPVKFVAQNSPRVLHPTSLLASNLMTSSSLIGEYLMLSIQVSKDLIPIISDSRKVPDQVFSLSISDVTYDQLVNLHGNKMTGRIYRSSGARGFTFAPFLKLEEALMVK